MAVPCRLSHKGNLMTFINPNRPAYRVQAIHGFYADDHLYEEGDTLYFDGEPNEELEPLNEVAYQKLQTYLEKLDTFGRLAAEKFGRPWVGRARSLDGAIAIASEDERKRVAITGTHNVDGTRPEGERTTERIENVEAPETGSVNPKKRGRPSKASQSATLHIA